MFLYLTDGATRRLVFVLYSDYGYGISNEKLNGRQAFESLGLLGALTFLFKQRVS